MTFSRALLIVLSLLAVPAASTRAADPADLWNSGASVQQVSWNTSDHGSLFGCIKPRGTVFNTLNTFLCKAEQRDIGGHCTTSLLVVPGTP